MTKVLVTGGVRCGKSRYAEGLLADRPATYLAPGYPADPGSDADWAARVAAHRDRRPAHWRTVETLDLAGAIAAADTPVLIDCLGTWLARSIDAWGTWDEPLTAWRDRFDAALGELREAWLAAEHTVVAVTNEVGWGVVPAYRSGRVFADLLGTVNHTLGRISDDVVLVVAGRALHLP